MRFEPLEQGQPKNPPEASFIFSGSPGWYRLHCVGHGNNMMFFLGTKAPRQWVVWDTAVPTDGSWELLDVEWIGQDCDGVLKIRGHRGRYVKWAVSGFTSSEADGATEFILREV